MSWLDKIRDILCKSCRDENEQLQAAVKEFAFRLGKQKEYIQELELSLKKCREDTPPPETKVKWEDVRETKFGKKPHMNATYAMAIHSTRQSLIWDGIRNPGAALKCDKVWPYNGVSKGAAEQTIHMCKIAMKEMDVLIRMDDYEPRDPTRDRGVWARQPIKLEDFWRMFNAYVLPAFRAAEKLNGCRGLAEKLCP